MFSRLHTLALRLGHWAPMHSHSQNNLNFIFSPAMSSFAHPPPTAFPPSQPDDPNSPVLFKDNLNLVQTQISTVRSLAHEALNAMCVLILPVARDAWIEPRTCSRESWCIEECLRTLDELLYTTGVGSLPLLPPEATEPFTEEQLADQANKAISTLFTLHTRMQETAAVAASIMAAPEQAPRAGR
ncbi:hypothetical protein BJV74DRAFT_248186 [Russula compacta]|nr:hypothetical protein BJV74DRAFT_248186 [Russula compacta]